MLGYVPTIVGEINGVEIVGIIGEYDGIYTTAEATKQVKGL